MYTFFKQGFSIYRLLLRKLILSISFQPSTDIRLVCTYNIDLTQESQLLCGTKLIQGISVLLSLTWTYDFVDFGTWFAVQACFKSCMQLKEVDVPFVFVWSQLFDQIRLNKIILYLPAIKVT